MTKPIDLRYLLGLMRLVDKQAFIALSERILGKGHSLPLGATLGTVTPAPQAAKGLNPYDVCVCAAEALTAVSSFVGPAMLVMERQLRNANRIGIGGDVIAALSSTGVVVAIVGVPLADGASNAGAVVMACMAFFGALSSLYARYLKRDIFGAENSLAGNYRTLVNGAWECQVLSAKLKLLLSKDSAAAGGGDAFKMVGRAEKLAEELYRAVKGSGI